MSQLRLGDFGDEPQEAVRDLLQALVGGGKLSAGAQALVGEAVRGTANQGIQRLLPMLRDHSAARSLSDEVRQGLEIRYRQCATKFLMREHMLRRVVEAMAGEGIDVLLLKGFPLACSVYAKPAHRHSGDIDFAVPPSRYADGEAVLLRLGFQPIRRAGYENASQIGIDTHAQDYRHPSAHVVVDLHCHVLAHSLWPDADTGFWAAAEPLAVPGLVGARTLSAEHHLFHACLHGYSRSVLHLSVRWMLDAHLLLVSRRQAFRWDLVEQEARGHRCGPLIAACLAYLATNLDSPVPKRAIERLAAMPMPSYDRAYFKLYARRNRQNGPLLRLRLMWNALLRQRGRQLYSPLPLLGVLARRWGCSPGKVIFIALFQRWREPQWMIDKRRKAEGARCPSL